MKHNVYRWIVLAALLVTCVSVAEVVRTGQRSTELERPINWQTRFTFEGQIRPGPYTVDPHIWVYTKEFAERFGMPSEWIDPELKGIEAAAWRKTKTGYVTCGWGGKKDACKEEDAAVLELYIDTSKVKLPWAPWSKESDQIRLGPGVDSIGFLTSQKCERRRELSSFPGINWNDKKCPIFGIAKSHLADRETGKEILFFVRSATFKGQGNFMHVNSYDKSTYSNLTWIRIGYTRPVGLFNPPEAAVLTLETRDAPLGKTLRIYHTIVLPEGFDRRIKVVLDSQRENEREFYKKSLDMK